MRFKRSEATVKIPGTPQTIKRGIAEWICPDCDYFEEVEETKT